MLMPSSGLNNSGKRGSLISVLFLCSPNSSSRVLPCYFSLFFCWGFLRCNTIWRGRMVLAGKGHGLSRGEPRESWHCWYLSYTLYQLPLLLFFPLVVTTCTENSGTSASTFSLCFKRTGFLTISLCRCDCQKITSCLRDSNFLVQYVSSWSIILSLFFFFLKNCECN